MLSWVQKVVVKPSNSNHLLSILCSGCNAIETMTKSKWQNSVGASEELTDFKDTGDNSSSRTVSTHDKDYMAHSHRN